MERQQRSKRREVKELRERKFTAILPPQAMLHDMALRRILRCGTSSRARRDLQLISGVFTVWLLCSDSAPLEGALIRYISIAMLTYLLGPFLALLPKRWRKTLPFSQSIHWSHAVTLSGFAEFVVSFAASLQWYTISMNTWVNRGLDVATSGKAAPGITDHAIGAMALLMWANHPLTWVLAYFSVEGAVRMCGAAFSDSLMGTLPLFLVDKTARALLGGSKTDQDAPGVASSFIGAVSEKILESSVPLSADEVSFQKSASEEIMEIRASRKKPDWDPPRVVRCADNYYRLENFSKCPGPRPFRYTLRRLSAGVPGRNVLLYDPQNTVVAGRR